MFKTLSMLKREALDLLFPAFCFGCKKEGLFLCLSCRPLLKITPPSCFYCHKLSWPIGRTCKLCRLHTKVYAFLSPLSYGDTIIKDLIHNLKYNRVRNLAEILADLLTDYLEKYKIKLPVDSLLLPIPLHKRRQRKRGFNQSVLIAKHLSEKLGLDFSKKILVKTKPTKPQIELKAEERRKNLAGVFAITSPDLIKNKIIVLLDDVKTTGTTLEEAAIILKSAGAKRVWAITIAH